MHVASRRGWRVADDDKLTRVLEVMDARVQLFRSNLASELRLKDELRAQQVAITRQEDTLIACLSEQSVQQPATFKARELRLQKLVEDQLRLQPVLARAAIQRTHTQDQLSAALRQKLAIELGIERRDRDEARSSVYSAGDQLLFERNKRR
jgi:hypothetical protein